MLIRRPDSESIQVLDVWHRETIQWIPSFRKYSNFDKKFEKDLQVSMVFPQKGRHRY